MRLPDFIAIGPIRTGTTWLDTIFRGHLGLPARIKETQFFGRRYHLGLDWYARHFSNCRESIAGEFGPTYFFAPAARAQIARDLPSCKIICTLREPVARIYSHYQLWRKIAILKEPFAEAIANRPQLSARMHYAPDLREWRKVFGNRMLVLIYEDSRHDRQAYVDQICDFIGAPRFDLKTVAGERRMVAHFEQAPRNYRWARRARDLSYALEERRLLRLRNLLDPAVEWCMTGGEPFSPLDPDLAAELRARCADDVAEIEELLDRDLSIWKHSPAARLARSTA